MTTDSPAAGPQGVLSRWWARLIVGLLAMASTLLAGAVANRLARELGGDAITLFVVTNVCLVCYALLAYLLFVRRVERRLPLELAGQGAWRPVLLGFAAGAALFATTMALITFRGGYQIVGSGPIAGAAASLFLAASTSVLEELAFRGVLLRILEERFGSWFALAASSILFASLSALNRVASPVSLLAILLGSGLLYSASYLRYRTLWVPIGLHLGWIWTQGGLFGAPVSGSGTFGLLVGVFRGPVWLTGGAFGPEASVAAVAVTLVASAWLVYSSLQRGNIRRWPASARARP